MCLLPSIIMVLTAIFRFITNTCGWFPFRLGALLLAPRFRTVKTFVADALLSLQKTFVVAVASLSHRAKLPAGVRWAASLRYKVSGQQDVGHEGVITGRDAFSLRSSISLIPKESTSLHSTNIQCIYLKMLSITFSDELSFNIYLLFQIWLLLLTT